MGRIEKAEFTNMCMICDGTRVLVQDRLNPNWPGLTFPGGHVEPGESFVSSVIREVKEETGLDIADVQLCGMKHFVQKDGSSRYIVLLYRTSNYSGELKSSAEGRVFWMERSELTGEKLAHGFDSMLDVFEDEHLSENFWYYQNEKWMMKNQ